MIGGLLKSASRLALVAAAGVIAGGVGAQAADLGGNCCADLEERVAELEATTARKGTRRMGLQLYGQVSETVIFWDDGGERNTYVVENNAQKNRFGAQGTAKINSDWSAGFKLEWQIRAYRSSAVNQKGLGQNEGLTSSAYATQSLSLRHAYWYVRSESLGYLAVGQQDDSASGIVSINLAAPDGFATTNLGFFGGAMLLRPSGQAPGNAGLSTSKTWFNTLTIHNGDGPQSFDYTRASTVRYNTPTIAGFTASASWGEDDMWAVALRYAGDLGPIRIAAGVAFSDWRDANAKTQCANPGATALPLGPVSNVDCSAWQAGVSVQHTPTGLYASGGWAEITDDNRDAAARHAGWTGATVDKNDTFWWVQVGWEAKLNSLGRTTFWGEYDRFENGFGVVSNAITTLAAADTLNPTATDKFITSTRAKAWGFGITQDIDAAAMKLYIGYVLMSADDISLATVAAPHTASKAREVEDIQMIYTGATVRF